MKRSVLYIAAVFLAAALCIVVLTVSFMPRARVSLFVLFNGDKLEQAIKSDGGIPANIGYTTFNIWANGDMTEFILLSYGSGYYGCYYSRSGAPSERGRRTDKNRRKPLEMECRRQPRRDLAHSRELVLF